MWCAETKVSMLRPNNQCPEFFSQIRVPVIVQTHDGVFSVWDQEDGTTRFVKLIDNKILLEECLNGVIPVAVECGVIDFGREKEGTRNVAFG